MVAIPIYVQLLPLHAAFDEWASQRPLRIRTLLLSQQAATVHTVGSTVEVNITGTAGTFQPKQCHHQNNSNSQQKLKIHLTVTSDRVVTDTYYLEHRCEMTWGIICIVECIMTGEQMCPAIAEQYCYAFSRIGIHCQEIYYMLTLKFQLFIPYRIGLKIFFNLCSIGEIFIKIILFSILRMKLKYPHC